MNLDEFPSLDFLLPYTGNTTLQMKLIFGALVGLVAGIMLILISSLLIYRYRRKKRKQSHQDMCQQPDAQQQHQIQHQENQQPTSLNILHDSVRIEPAAMNKNSKNSGGFNNSTAMDCDQPNIDTHNTNGFSRILSDSNDSLEKNPDIIPQSEYIFFSFFSFSSATQHTWMPMWLKFEFIKCLEWGFIRAYTFLLSIAVNFHNPRSDCIAASHTSLRICLKSPPNHGEYWIPRHLIEFLASRYYPLIPQNILYHDIRKPIQNLKKKSQNSLCVLMVKLEFLAILHTLLTLVKKNFFA